MNAKRALKRLQNDARNIIIPFPLRSRNKAVNLWFRPVVTPPDRTMPVRGACRVVPITSDPDTLSAIASRADAQQLDAQAERFRSVLRDIEGRFSESDGGEGRLRTSE